jgi:hypothetical protein
LKYLNVILTLIAVGLIAISLRLWHIGLLLENLNYNGKLSLNSSQALINSNTHLADEVLNLKNQVETLGERFLKK